MLRILFAVGIAGLVFAGGSGTTQAAPILPLPTVATAGIDNMTDVQWGRRCWRDRWADCAAAVVEAGAPAGALGEQALVGAVALVGVATAGMTAGAVCIAGGDFQPPAGKPQRAAISRCPL